jgi:hypothetical protein
MKTRTLVGALTFGVAALVMSWLPTSGRADYCLATGKCELFKCSVLRPIPSSGMGDPPATEVCVGEEDYGMNLCRSMSGKENPPSCYTPNPGTTGICPGKKYYVLIQNTGQPNQGYIWLPSDDDCEASRSLVCTGPCPP